jgi:4-amino-4-deoxy-L-arabinose transferase-like glycosyltransferase
VAGAVLALAALEALVLLHVLDLGRLPLVVHDYQVYEQLGLNLLERATHSPEAGPPYGRSYFRTPGYPAYIALVYALGGRSLILLRASQFLLLALTALGLWRLARRFADDRVAAIAAILCVTYPPFAFLATLYATEVLATLATVLLLLALVRVTDRDGSMLRPALLGCGLGGLVLIRPGFVLLPLACAALLAARLPAAPRRSRLLAPAALLAGAGLVVGPWIVRNSLLVGRLVGPSSGGGWSLLVSAQQYSGAVSNQLLYPEWVVVIAEHNRRWAEAERRVLGEPRPLEPDYARLARIEAELDEAHSRAARAEFGRLPPARLVAQLPKRVFWLWSTADFSPWPTRPINWPLKLWHVLTFGLAVLGVWSQRATLSSQWALWLVPVYLTALHLVYHVEARYTIPARPFLLVYCAMGFAWLLGARATKRASR